MFYLFFFVNGDFGSPPFTCIYNFIGSSGQLALQEGVEQFNQHYQANKSQSRDGIHFTVCIPHVVLLSRWQKQTPEWGKTELLVQIMNNSLYECHYICVKDKGQVNRHLWGRALTLLLHQVFFPHTLTPCSKGCNDWVIRHGKNSGMLVLCISSHLYLSYLSLVS